MFSVFWVAAFTVLLVLHFIALPRLASNAVGVSPGATHMPARLETRYFAIWCATVAGFTAAVYLTSAAIWGRAGYMGMLFFLLAPLIWVFAWLTGAMPSAEDTDAFEAAESATLWGSILGTAIGWGTRQLL